MTNPIDALKNADPGRGAVPPDDHWRTRERIIMDAATQTGRARGLQRLVPSTAIGAVFALGCGLIVSSAFSGGGLPTIALGGGSGNLAATAESGKAALDAMWLGNYTFTLADGVDVPAGAGDVWRWSRPSRSDVDVLMRRLKLTGDVRKLGKDVGGGWSVAADDPVYPDATQLSVSLNGSWYWWNPDSSSTIAVGECVAPTAPDGTVDDTKECVYQEPAPAKNLPSDDEVRAKAEPLLGLGGEYKVTDIWRDKWSVYLTANYVLPDGTLTGMYAGVGFGENGVMMNASGQLGALEKVGSYPTISARDAVARLSSGMMAYARGGGIADDVSPPLAAESGDSGQSVESGSGSSGESNEGSAGGGGATEPSVEPTVEPIDPIVIEEPYEVPEVKVTLTKVKVTYSTLWGADNYIWVLPTYEYTDSNGGIWTAVAIADQYLEGGPTAETTTTVETPTETTVPQEVTTTTVEQPVIESTLPEPPPTTP